MRDSADTCPAAWRRYRAGRSLRVTRSPVPPKSNMSNVGSTANEKSSICRQRSVASAPAFARPAHDPEDIHRILRLDGGSADLGLLYLSLIHISEPTRQAE